MGRGILLWLLGVTDHHQARGRCYPYRARSASLPRRPRRGRLGKPSTHRRHSALQTFAKPTGRNGVEDVVCGRGDASPHFSY
jgi:hypothetical protein